MIEIIKDTLLDSLKLIPFLFLAFLLMEYIEHKLDNKNKKIFIKSGKYGPFIGSILGAFPQCGFSAAATNLYAARIISIGTLISIYLSTSDEMLPIFLSKGVNINICLKIIAIKIMIGMIFGFVIDYILRNKKCSKNDIHDFCNDEKCDCNHGIFKSSIKHTINILLFITIISFFLNMSLFYLGEENIAKIFMKNSIFGPFIASLIGLIPNCAASVVITELYLSNAITFGSTMAGLLTGSGISLLLLFKTNKHLKENLGILFSVYGIGVISGIVIDLFKIIM
ncbi:MAG: putative manganese transporter [Bacilli bacterium]